MTSAQALLLPVRDAQLPGDLQWPATATGLVIFVHGSGSSRHSPRNQQVARYFNSCGLATLLFDLLTPEENRIDMMTREWRFNIPLLSQRLIEVLDWLTLRSDLSPLPFGLFGASTGAAAALQAAAARPQIVHAVVSRGGRSDLAGQALAQVCAPTLLIVGAEDPEVLKLNQESSRLLHCEQELVVVPGATHLFEELGAMEEVARLAGEWFSRHLHTDA